MANYSHLQPKLLLTATNVPYTYSKFAALRKLLSLLYCTLPQVKTHAREDHSKTPETFPYTENVCESLYIILKSHLRNKKKMTSDPLICTKAPLQRYNQKTV